MAAQSDQPSLIVVVGETASGKSTLGLEIAKKYNGEIICADSRTIYKGMDIGTAKPTKIEQEAVRHHLLDVVAPGKPFTAADFKQLTQKAIADVHSRGKVAVMVGGTGLYVDAVVFDYNFSTQADLKLREKLEGLSIDELIHEVQEQGITVPSGEKNKRHLVRLLERGESNDSDRRALRDRTLMIGLRVARSALRTRIQTRVEIMFRRGLRREVEELRQKYGWESEALTGIGYREFRAHELAQASMSEVKRQIVQDTLHLAKRQRTWFKRNTHIHWIEDPKEAFGLVDAFLDQSQV
jgi:tRNA dimethylallyltransferase